MKNFLSNRDEVSKINTIFAMILVMVGIAYYYLINLTSDLIWVVMCGFAFIAIPAFFTILHGIFTKRKDVTLLALGVLLLGILGFASKLLHGIGQLTWYSYLYATAYALSGIFVFSMADKVAFGKTLLTKWWFIVAMAVLNIVPAILLYVIPENFVSSLIMIENIINILMYLAALGLGVYCIIKKKEPAFSYTYAIYTFLMTVAYICQIIGAGAIRWYNLFLMLGLVAIPYVLIYAVRCKE